MTITNVITVRPPELRIGARETIPRWSTASRLMLGAITFAMPVIAGALATWSLTYGASPPPVMLGLVFGFFIVHGLLTLFYVAFAGQNPRLRSRGRWMTSLVLGGPITIPVYWLIHVWGAPRVSVYDLDGEVPDVDMSQRRAIAYALATSSPT